MNTGRNIQFTVLNAVAAPRFTGATKFVTQITHGPLALQ